MKHPVLANWSSLVVRAALAFAVAVIALLDVSVTFSTLLRGFGLYAVGDGIAGTLGALPAHREARPSWAALVEGISSIVCGAFALHATPPDGRAVVILLAAYAATVSTLRATLATEIAAQETSRALPLFGGSALGLVLSFVLFSSGHPSALTTAQLLGVVGAVTAFVFIALASGTYPTASTRSRPSVRPREQVSSSSTS